MDSNLPGSSVHGLSQARILEWVVISSPGDLPNQRIVPASPALADGFFTTEPRGKPPDSIHFLILQTLLPTPWNSPPHYLFCSCSSNPSLRGTLPSVSLCHTQTYKFTITHFPCFISLSPSTSSSAFHDYSGFSQSPHSSELLSSFPLPSDDLISPFTEGMEVIQKQTSPTNLPTWYPFSTPLRC